MPKIWIYHQLVVDETTCFCSLSVSVSMVEELCSSLSTWMSDLGNFLSLVVDELPFVVATNGLVSNQV
jgi:hypothetical protein